MKKRFLRLLSIWLVLCLIFSNVSLAECNHDWELQYDPVNNYEVVDEEYHKIVSTTLYYICEICEETKIETQMASTQHKSKHRFSNSGYCYSCGYEGEEKHEHDWELQYDPVNNYEVVDEEYHKIVSTTLYYICYECEETKVETQRASNQHKSRHRYDDDGYCYSCGYEGETKHEHDWELQYAPEYEYEIVNEKYHRIITTTLYYICYGCGEEYVEVEETLGGSTKHDFNNKNCCVDCGYKKVVTPAPTTPAPTTPVPVTQAPLTPVPTTPTQTPINTPIITVEPTPIGHICEYENSNWYQSFKYYNEEMHTYHHVVTPICKICGKKGEKTNTLKYGYHKFENDVCRDCEYVRRPVVSNEDKAYATKRIQELEILLDLVITAMENGEILYDDAYVVIQSISAKIYSYKEVLNGTRELLTIQESNEIDIVTSAETQKLLIQSGFGKNVPYAHMIGYYQIINGLEVTGWMTEETYNSINETVEVKTEISSHMDNVEKLSAEKLVDLIGSGIQFIQENKDNKEACDRAYAEIEILVRYLKQTPEYLSNYNLSDVDWIFKVGEDTPGFKDIVDVAFTKENIYANGLGTLPNDYLDQYNEQYVANTLTVIDGVLIISVAGKVVYKVVTVVGSKVIPIAGYTVAQWEIAVQNAINSVDYNKANNHILQEKHLWNHVVNNPTWTKISIYIQETLIYGQDFINTNTGFHGKRYVIDGHVVEVMYNIVDNVLKITDAWVVK